MLIFARRSRREDPYLEWKVRIFAVAAVLTLAGMYFEERWMTLTALALLLVGMLLRFAPGASGDSTEGEEAEDFEEAEEIEGED